MAQKLPGRGDLELQLLAQPGQAPVMLLAHQVL